MPRPYVNDAYAPLSHKDPLKGVGERRPGVATWVPIEDQRRLAAYTILGAYCDNVSRYQLPTSLSDDQVEKYREYGHASRVRDGAVSSVLGDEQTISVAGATEFLDLEDGQEPPPEAAMAQAALDYLRAWADDELLWLEMLETEQDAVGLGDGVYTLYWDPDKKRARIKSYDPGFFFPDPDQRDQKDFPTRVHFAWEQNSPDGKTTELHRLTYRLGQILPAVDVKEPSNFLQNDQGELVLQPGDRWGNDGRIIRDYPWADEPSTVTCYFSHGVWDLTDIKGDLFNLSGLHVEWRVPERDLRIDFMPVLHVPNTPASRGFFGRSILTLIAQILDDLAATNTDLLESAALAGNATLVTKGGPEAIEAGPGARLELAVDGDAHYLDVSKNVDALLKVKDDLKRDLSENSRISKATLGQTDASNAASGLSLALSFSPEQGLIRQLRSVRGTKNPLLLKMVLRFAQAAEQLPAGPTPRAEVLLGSFLPADQAQAVSQVKDLLAAKAISTHTAVVMLQEVGFPIDDAVAEVERIARENFAAAVQLVDATGNPGDAYRLLGLTPATNPIPAPPAA